jgi:hypothetical protein
MYYSIKSYKGPFPLAYFARVSPSAMAQPPNCSLCFSRAITRVIAQRKQLGGDAIADGETRAKNASGKREQKRKWKRPLKERKNCIGT